MTAWTFLRKKEGRLSEREALRGEWGDCWVWVAYNPDSRIVLGFVRGKRCKDRAVRLLKRMHEVLAPGCLPLFTSDALSCYKDALVEVFGVERGGERRFDPATGGCGARRWGSRSSAARCSTR